MLEELYETEIVQKEKTKESVRKQVSDLLSKMNQEQRKKMAARQSRSLNNSNMQCYQQDLITKSVKVGLSFIELWVTIHENRSWSTSDTKNQVCLIISKAKSWGKVPQIVAKNIADHLEFLLEEKFICY